MNVVALIPVRAADLGPRGVMPQVGGRPLLGYTVDAAKEAERVQVVFLTTDSEEVRSLGVSLGAEAPFVRPPELCARDVPVEAVLQHALAWIEDGGLPVDVVVPLEISHPIRPDGLVDQVVDVLVKESFDTVFAVAEVRAALWSVNEYGELKQLDQRGPTRATRRLLYKELGGLASAIRADVIREGQRVGKKVGMVPIHDTSALVDTQDEAGLELVRRILAG